MTRMNSITGNVSDIVEQLKNMLIDAIDDPELVKGMPVGVQIVTGRFGEEKAVGIAKLIESL